MKTKFEQEIKNEEEVTPHMMAFFNKYTKIGVLGLSLTLLPQISGCAGTHVHYVPQTKGQKTADGIYVGYDIASTIIITNYDC
jgi:hypothetical protein